jgi:hypothetical protein
VQCHTHKFDPFSQREYYRLLAYFNSTADVGPSVQPLIPAPTAENVEIEARAKEEEAELRAALTTWTPAFEEELDDFRRGSPSFDRDEVEEVARLLDDDSTHLGLGPKGALAESGAILNKVWEDGSYLASGDTPAKDSYTFEFETPGVPLRSVRIDVLTDESLPATGPGRTGHGNFVLNEVTATLRSEGQERSVAFSRARADHHQIGSPVWPPEHTIDGDPRTGWAIGGGEQRPHRLELEFEEALSAPTGSTLSLRLDQNFGSQHVIGKLAVMVREDGLRDKEVVLPPDVDHWMSAQDHPASDEEALQLLREWFLAHTPTLGPHRDLGHLSAELAGLA